MPFISEEIWQMLDKRAEGQSIMVSDMPVGGKVRTDVLKDFEHARLLVSAIRNIRKARKLPARESLRLFVSEKSKDASSICRNMVKRLANISDIEKAAAKPADSVSLMVGTAEYYLLLDDKIDITAEIERLETELEYNRGFLASVLKKLDNKKFVNKAPARVVEHEQKKKEDTETKIASLLERLKELKGE